MRHVTVLIFILALVSASLVRGQVKKGKWGVHTSSKKAFEYYKSGEEAYARDEHEKALEALDQALARDADFIEAWLLKADLYFRQEKYVQEIENIEKALQIDSMYFPAAYYNMGVALFNAGRYDEVSGWMNRYKTRVPGSGAAKKADGYIERAGFAMRAVKHPVPIVTQCLPDRINSAYDEYWPSISADEEKLVFTVLVPRDTFAFKQRVLPRNAIHFKEDFYSSEFTGGEWSERKPILSINTDGNEGALALSADGSWMFFTACGRADSKGSCDLYFSRRTRQGWTRPVNLGSPVNTPYWESQPSFSADGETLYFVSSRPGGQGQKDIWKATVSGFDKNGTPHFTNVVNLGAAVNTSGDENSPFIHQDNQTLYFSSEGWPGMGKMDLFMSLLGDDGQWQEPRNLGFPLNTAADEIGLVLNAKGDRAYYSSTGNGRSHRGRDLYTFEMPQAIRPLPAAYVKGRVFDKATNQPLRAVIRVSNIGNGQPVVRAQSDDYSGAYLFCLPLGHSYGVTVDKEGYLFHSGHFDVTQPSSIDQPQILDIFLSRIQTGECLVLRNVFFESDSHALKEESGMELNEIVRLLEKNPSVRAEIGGHTDNVGTAIYNRDLSQKRARAVYDYLLRKGIDAGRLEYRGYGFDEPVDQNDTEEGRARNRRTEVKIL